MEREDFISGREVSSNESLTRNVADELMNNWSNEDIVVWVRNDYGVEGVQFDSRATNRKEGCLSEVRWRWIADTFSVLASTHAHVFVIWDPDVELDI